MLEPVVVTLVLLCCYGRESFRWLKLQLIAIGTGLIILVMMFVSVFPDIVSLFARNIGRNDDRAALWKFTLDLIKKHPWLGVGPQNFSYFPNMYGSHPHNAVLLIAVEWGIPAAIIAVVLVLWGYFAWLKRSRILLSENNSILIVALTASLTAGISHALVCGVTIMPMSQLFLVIVTGWIIGIYYPIAKDVSSTVNLFPRSFLILGLFFALIAIAIGIFPTVIHMAGESSRAPVVELFMPRFWLLGQLYVR